MESNHLKVKASYSCDFAIYLLIFRGTEWQLKLTLCFVRVHFLSLNVKEESDVCCKDFLFTSCNVY